MKARYWMGMAGLWFLLLSFFAWLQAMAFGIRFPFAWGAAFASICVLPQVLLDQNGGLRR